MNFVFLLQASTNTFMEKLSADMRFVFLAGAPRTALIIGSSPIRGTLTGEIMVSSKSFAVPIIVALKAKFRLVSHDQMTNNQSPNCE